jgi:hypothetical protein
MQSNNNKNTENRRSSDRKPAGGASASVNRLTRERARAHHGLLKGPFYPLVSNLPVARSAA